MARERRVGARLVLALAPAPLAHARVHRLHRGGALVDVLAAQTAVLLLHLDRSHRADALVTRARVLARRVTRLSVQRALGDATAVARVRPVANPRLGPGREPRADGA